MNHEVSLVPNEGGRSEVIAISAASAQSSVLYTENAGYVNFYSTVDCYVRMGTDPTAVDTGVDQYIPGGNLLRIGPIPSNYKLAIIAGGAGLAYITKES